MMASRRLALSNGSIPITCLHLWKEMVNGLLLKATLRWRLLILRPSNTKKPGLEDRAFCVSGAENRNRTYDLRVTSALLYRLSYTGVRHKLASEIYADNI